MGKKLSAQSSTARRILYIAVAVVVMIFGIVAAVGLLSPRSKVRDQAATAPVANPAAANPMAENVPPAGGGADKGDQLPPANPQRDVAAAIPEQPPAAAEDAQRNFPPKEQRWAWILLDAGIYPAWKDSLLGYSQLDDAHGLRAPLRTIDLHVDVPMADILKRFGPGESKRDYEIAGARFNAYRYGRLVLVADAVQGRLEAYGLAKESDLNWHQSLELAHKELNRPLVKPMAVYPDTPFFRDRPSVDQEPAGPGRGGVAERDADGAQAPEKPLTTLAAHATGVGCVAALFDGTRLITGGGARDLPKDGEPAADVQPPDTSLKMWDRRTGKLLRQFEGHQAAVTSADVSGCGQILVSSSADRTVRVWWVDTGEELRRFEHNAEVIACVFWNGLVFSICGDSDVHVWDVWSGNHRTTSSGSNSLRCLRLNPGFEGPVLVAGGDDGALTIWRPGQQLQDLASNPIDLFPGLALGLGSALVRHSVHQGAVRDAAIIVGDPYRLVSIGEDATLRVCDVRSKRLGGIGEEKLPDSVKEVAWQRVPKEASRLIPVNTEEVAVASGTTIGIRRMRSTWERPLIKGHKDVVSALAVFRQGELAGVSGSWDGSVRFWGVPDEHTSSPGETWTGLMPRFKDWIDFHHVVAPGPKSKSATKGIDFGIPQDTTENLRVVNGSDHCIQIGLRSKQQGADFFIAPRDTLSLEVPEGRYDVLVTGSDDPQALLKGGPVTISAGKRFDLSVGDTQDDKDQKKNSKKEAVHFRRIK